jgi:hypothetical protein
MARRKQPAQSKASRGRRRAGSRRLERAGEEDGKAPEPFQTALAAVAGLIKRLRHPCTVIGGLAVVAHGHARTTADIDLAVVAEPVDVDEILRDARSSGFEPRIHDAAAFARENLVLLLEHVVTRVPVDLSFALQPFEREAAEAAVVRHLGPVSLPVTPLGALIVYKMIASRPKDLDDVQALLATGRPFDAKVVMSTLRELDAVLDTDRAGELKRLIATHRGR